MKNIKLITIAIIFINLYSCTETIEVQPIPAPWILLNKGSDIYNYIYTEDTIVKPVHQGQTSWNGYFEPVIYSPGGLKDVEIKKNGEKIEIAPLKSDRFNESYSESIKLNFITNFDTCIFDIKATDLKNQVSTKRVRVLFSITGNKPSPPTAIFAATKIAANAGVEIQFYSYSTNASSYFWSFGDNTNSNEQHPKHSYTTPGVYTVSLRVSNFLGENTTIKSNYITVMDPEKMIADNQGNVYQIKKIGNQTWMIENLKATKYRNGEKIKYESNDNQWNLTNVSAHCFLNNDSAKAKTLGCIYNHYAVTDSRGIAPAGWHVASNNDWLTLMNYLIANGYNYDGTTTGNKIAKSMASVTGGWASSSVVGSVGNIDYTGYRNKSGFEALAAGGRFYNYGGSYDPSGTIVVWWTSNSLNTESGYTYYFNYQDIMLKTMDLNKRNGFYVRCVKD